MIFKILYRGQNKINYTIAVIITLTFIVPVKYIIVLINIGSYVSTTTRDVKRDNHEIYVDEKIHKDGGQNNEQKFFNIEFEQFTTHNFELYTHI